MRIPLSFLTVVVLPSFALSAPPDYQRDIRPIFQQFCVGCHGPEKQRAGLRVDSLGHLRKGGNSGNAIVPGKANDSVLTHAMTGTNDYAIMPPKDPRPKPEQIALIRDWINAGAKGEDVGPAVVSGTKSSHWSFQPIKRHPTPNVDHPTFLIRNPIDAFILARLRKEKIDPSPEADRVTLIRRLSLDLLGLPPSIDEVKQFVEDPSPNAYENLVDRLLANPHYGERWGRHWLDAARYADSNGYSIDAPRSIWKYRDWVIDAINSDMPFDQFTLEQLAGDLLPKPTPSQLVATGFHRNTQINQEGGIDIEQFRVESIVDRVNTTSTVWLGLTVGCAQCHDHKFDPIAQREYYEMFAFFNSVDEPNYELIPPDVERQRAKIRERLAVVESRLKSLDRTSVDAIEKWERGLTDDSREQLSKPIRAIFDVAPNGRSTKQLLALEQAYRACDELRHVVGTFAQPPIVAAAQVHLLQTRQSLVRERDQLKKSEPVAVTTMIVRERKAPRTTNVHLGGDFLRKGVEVAPTTPAVLPPLQSQKPNRVDLAKWLTDPSNPLTSRVTVNRFWEKFFGVGIVETENDFGTQGTRPSHPELLDWLASEFQEQKWSMKSMHKMIVMSSTYRQSSKVRPDLATIDARNRLLARQNRFRLDAEIVRDVSLHASGLLTPTIGGPSVYPPQPDGVYNFTQIKREWKTADGADRFRRGMYTYFQRSAAHPGLITFDAPDATVSCTRRVRSNTPLQALILLNDQGYIEFANALADRVLKATLSDPERLRFAFKLCVAREPNPRELERLTQFLSSQKSGSDERTAWVMTARVLLNLDEFITRE